MDFFYTTEYQRSFLSNFKKRQDEKPSYSSDLNTYPKESTDKCSIGVQANLNNQNDKKVHFDLKPKESQKFEPKYSYNEPLTPRKVSAKEFLANEKRQRHFSDKIVDRAPDKLFNKSRYSEEIQNDTPSSLHRQTVSPPYHSQMAYSLDLRAGNESENYHRAPFIQKKKRTDTRCSSNSSVYRVSSEPSLQKKKITLYPKNHNILLTSTVKEEESPRTTGRPLKYESSYNLAYKDRPYRHDSPIMSVEYTMNRKNTSDSVRSAFYEFDDSNRYHKRSYDKGVYKTEYQQYFTKRDTKESSPLISAARDNKEFLDYYKEMMEKRVVAYSPSLSELHQSSSEQRGSPRNEKHRRDEDEKEKPSQRSQSFVNGRYTRTYKPEIYSP